MMRKSIYTFFLLLLLLTGSQLNGADGVVLLKTRLGDPQFEQEIDNDMLAVRNALAHTPIRIFVVQSKEALAALPAKVRAENCDRLHWLIFGFVSSNVRRSALVFTDGRLDLADFLPVLQNSSTDNKVAWLCGNSAVALEFLLQNGFSGDLIAASDKRNYTQYPRYSRYFTEAVQELGSLSNWEELAKLAGVKTAEFYQQARLSRGENSQICLDGVRYAYPFDQAGVKTAQKAAAPKSFLGGKGQLANIAEEAEPEVKYQSATPQSRQLVAAARELWQTKYADEPGVYTQYQVNYQIDDKKNAVREEFFELYLADRLLVEQATPPGVLANCGIDQITVFKPNGDYAVFTKGAVPTPEAGSVLQVRKSIRLARGKGMTEFEDSYYWPQLAPIAAWKFTVQGAQTQVKNVWKSANYLSYSRITTFQWPQLLAYIEQWQSRALTLGERGKRVLAQLIADLPDDEAKVRAAYDYVNNLRYVTIPLGAAALRPQAPDETIANGYGDCKDKAALLVAMCKELNIEAYAVVTKRGGQIDREFPGWQFNHMLVYLPVLGQYKELFLDATDRLARFGDVPLGDYARWGLLIKPGLNWRQVKPQKDFELAQNNVLSEYFDPEQGRWRASATGIWVYKFAVETYRGQQKADRLKWAQQQLRCFWPEPLAVEQIKMPELVPGACQAAITFKAVDFAENSFYNLFAALNLDFLLWTPPADQSSWDQRACQYRRTLKLPQTARQTAATQAEFKTAQNSLLIKLHDQALTMQITLSHGELSEAEQLAWQRQIVAGLNYARNLLAKTVTVKQDDSK